MNAAVLRAFMTCDTALLFAFWSGGTEWARISRPNCLIWRLIWDMYGQSPPTITSILRPNYSRPPAGAFMITRSAFLLAEVSGERKLQHDLGRHATGVLHGLPAAAAGDSARIPSYSYRDSLTS